jgi:hypothetical protein
MNLESWIDIIDFALRSLALLIGGAWALYQLKRFREFKNWIQLDLDANLYPLSQPEHAELKTWNREGKMTDSPRNCTHAIEFLLKFTNKGRTRIRLFNIQVGVNTMDPARKARFDAGDGHLELSRLHTSGNLVPPMKVKKKDVKTTSFYYIEPGVEQTITYFCLLSEPREFVQAWAKFSLEQERLFPENLRGPKGLYPHTAARIFRVPEARSKTMPGDAIPAAAIKEDS